MAASLAQRYKIVLANKSFWLSSIVGFVIFAGSIFANFYAGNYATEVASNSVTDIILSNVRVFDIDAIFIYGSLALIIFVAVLCLIEPKRIPFVLLSFSLFYFTRAIFISMTHLGPYPGHVDLNTGNILGRLFSGSDMFFSGHTGAPFLLALIFWDTKILRYLFLGWSVLFGVVVLLGHLHYTIDVFSAFFITYGIFHLAIFFFKNEYALFNSG
jgi:hypothetical protein